MLPAGGGIAEVVIDQGCHSNETMVAVAARGLRGYVSEPDRGRRRWKGKPLARAAVWQQPASHSGCPRETAAGTARRTAGTPERPSLRDGGHAPRVSARACQHPEASSGACLRPPSGLPHAQGNGRRGRGAASRAASARSSRPLVAVLNRLWRPVAGLMAAISLRIVRIRRTTWLHQLGAVVLHRDHSATGCYRR